MCQALKKNFIYIIILQIQILKLNAIPSLTAPTFWSIFETWKKMSLQSVCKHLAQTVGLLR